MQHPIKACCTLSRHIDRMFCLDAPLKAYSGNEDFVFVCYSHQDAEAVYAEISALNERGVNVWYDEGIRPGAEWTDELAQAIRSCSKLLFFVTPKAVASKHCRDEIQYAIANDVPILVIYLESTELPPGLALSLGSVQAVFKERHESDHYQTVVVDAIKDVPNRELHPATETYPNLTAKGGPPDSSARPEWLRSVISIAALAVIGILAWWLVKPELQTQTTSEATPERSLALLPFENRGGFDEDQYYPESLSEDLLNRLVAIEGLQVAPRRSSFAYNQQRQSKENFVDIARSLNVSALLTGYIRRQQDRFRIQIELIDVSAGTEVVRWSNSYDNQPEQRIPAIQAEVAQSVAQVFFPEGISASNQARLAQISTTSPEAYANLLQAQEIMRQPIVSPTLLDKAIDLFDAAIEIDPSYIWASAGLCSAYLRAYEESYTNFSAAGQACEKLAGAGEGLYTVRLALGRYYKELGDLDRAFTELSQASNLNQQSADVKLELAGVLEDRAVLNNDPVEKLEAEQTYLNAIRVEPNYWYSYHAFATFLTRLGRLDEAAAQLRKSHTLVPNSVSTLNNLASITYRQGNTDEAEQFWKKSLTISEENLYALTGLGILYHYKRDYQSAADYYLKATEFFPDDYSLWGRLGESYRLMSGKSNDAISVFNKAIELAKERFAINPNEWQLQGNLAVYSAYIGDAEAAEQHLTKMYELNPTQEPHKHYWSALVAEQIGDDAEVFEQLALALEYGWSEQLRFIADEPALDRFKATYPARFAALLARY
jgi:TolB-like protein/Flp pilus assembly protein TadD